jgi:hypothetical protein
MKQGASRAIVTPMPKPHPHAEATYRVVSRPDNTFAVEVTIPETSPTLISSFASEADAETWIVSHKLQVESRPTLSRFRGRGR